MTYSNEQISMLRLIRSNGIGGKTYLKLIENYGSAVKAIDQYKKWPSSKRITLANEKSIYDELQQADKLGAEYVFYNEGHYPLLLKYADDFPIVLSYIGDLNIVNEERTISIVGSRNGSFAGKKFASYIARELGLRNFITISGMARGVDTEVHQASVDAGKKTVAVIGSGLNNPYPSKEFAQKIINSGGLVISELPINEPPRDIHFPKRNRIIAALSKALLVVEAKSNSGSMITAQYAAEQGKTIFAVPGFPFDVNSSGVNKLIKDGAVMVRNIDDIMEELGSYFDVDYSVKSCSLSSIKREIDGKVYDINTVENFIISLLTTTISINIEDLYSDILKVHRIDFNQFSILLTKLELKEVILRSPDNGFVLASG